MNGLFDEEGNLSSVAEARAMISELQQEHASGISHHFGYHFFSFLRVHQATRRTTSFASA